MEKSLDKTYGSLEMAYSNLSIRYRRFGQMVTAGKLIFEMG